MTSYKEKIIMDMALFCLRSYIQVESVQLTLPSSHYNEIYWYCSLRKQNLQVQCSCLKLHTTEFDCMGTTTDGLDARDLLLLLF